MPKRTDIKSIMIIGAGPIVIGQACEFDYSGTQACKALKEEGYRLILVNSNPATIMTDPSLADATYIEPITPEFVAKIIEKERPDALLPTMGGQTALNTALALSKDGTLKKYNVELIGANEEAIAKAEDRELFRKAMDKIGLESPRSQMVSTLEQARIALEEVGLPAIIRPSFTMGGMGGGIAYNRDEFEQIVISGLELSPVNTVLVEESVLGWKEYEMEVVRDHADNCIIICSIENIDPMGIHTGDSVTVAPALTLTDKEYQIMRNASIKVLREIGVDTGGSNVQFAVNPETGRLVVIEMNPRVSRSSALASKATGFPIAKVAAKLAVGYTLDEIQNDITGTTPASFEPTIDYIVTKMPRFTFEKFPGTKASLTTSMKSVGEAMAIGRSFAESLQKVLRSMETGLTGLNEIDIPGAQNGANKDAISAAIAEPNPNRILIIAQAMRYGFTIDEIQPLCKFDIWFLEQIQNLVEVENEIRQNGIPKIKESWQLVKQMGFSDARLAELTNTTELEIRAQRHALNVRPVYKRIDTCAAEFAAQTSYMYGCYDQECESEPSSREKVIILGGGPNRIGQGIEFDYCCVHAAYALKEMNIEAIMVNCNPETVSTDYDTSDRLYFEPLTAEDVIEIALKEKQNGTLKGVIVQLGGQTPLKLSHDLETAGIPVLGTSPDTIDLAEDRERFQQLIIDLNLKQPINGIAYSEEQAEEIALRIGFPVLLRPSYVLGGRAMQIIYDIPSLRKYIKEAVRVSGNEPVLIDSFLNNAIEVDIDALCDGKDVYIAGVMEHIEQAGIHSGDSPCVLPPFTLSTAIIDEMKNQAAALAHKLGVIGLMNIQFAIQDGVVYILEVNPRASRTVPFVAKAIGIPVAGIATKLMAGEKLSSFELPTTDPDYISVKEAVFPFARFPGVDTILGPEMKSTGEVMGIDRNVTRAFAKSQLAASIRLPQKGTVFLSVKNHDKTAITPIAQKLEKMGFDLVATGGTAIHLQEQGLKVRTINKVLQGRPHIVDALVNGEINLVLNTTEGAQSIADSASIRQTASQKNVAHYTTMQSIQAAVDAIEILRSETLEVKPLQAYLKTSKKKAA